MRFDGEVELKIKFTSNVKIQAVHNIADIS